MSQENEDKLLKLIRLKRYENPGEEYIERFLEEFKERQRSELLKTSSLSLFLERLRIAYEQLGTLGRALTTGMSYGLASLLVLLTFILFTKKTKDNQQNYTNTNIPQNQNVYVESAIPVNMPYSTRKIASDKHSAQPRVIYVIPQQTKAPHLMPLNTNIAPISYTPNQIRSY